MHYEVRIAEVIDLTDRHTAIVRLADPSGRDACAGCAVASVCDVGRTADRIEVDMPVGRASMIGAGDRVEISAPASLTRRAVVVLLVLPLAVLVGAVAVAAAAGASEPVAVVIGLAALAAAFGSMYVLRRRIEPRGRWRIERAIRQ
ncbi:MAG: SoxR reducing system RseC family protein [Bacteroidales bacterium]|nr:SoxR reducing system RseC family protein [Bacteroidales bacterium]